MRRKQATYRHGMLMRLTLLGLLLALLGQVALQHLPGRTLKAKMALAETSPDMEDGQDDAGPEAYCLAEALQWQPLPFTRTGSASHATPVTSSHPQDIPGPPPDLAWQSPVAASAARLSHPFPSAGHAGLFTLH